MYMFYGGECPDVVYEEHETLGGWPVHGKKSIKLLVYKRLKVRSSAQLEEM